MEDLIHMFNVLSEEVEVNGVKHQSIITHSPITELETRYIHTLTNIEQGSLIKYKDVNYLTVTESIAGRYGKFKAKIEHCNHFLKFKGEIIKELIVDENGKPILNIYGDEQYKNVEGDPILIPSIVRENSFSISGQQLLIANNQIVIVVQHTTKADQLIKVNVELTLFNVTWKIVNVNKIRNGLLICTCDKKI